VILRHRHLRLALLACIAFALLQGGGAPARAQDDAGPPPAPTTSEERHQQHREERERKRESLAESDKKKEEEANDETPTIDTESTIDAVEEDIRWTLDGDLRPIITYQSDDLADGTNISDSDAGFRVRAGGVFALSRPVQLGARLAGRCFIDNCDLEFIFQPDAPTRNGLSGGQFTFDELYAHLFRKRRFDVAAGRLQTRAVLRGGVYAKSLDRNDSNNTRVTWTDGAHATYRGVDGWDGHLVLQYNHRDGPSNVLRRPLDFEPDDTRVTGFANIDNTDAWGPVVQRTLDVTYIPNALLADGSPDGRREDYWGLVGRLALRWPQRAEGPRLRFGGELGYAPNTPTNASRDLGSSGDTEGLAWNVVVSAMEFAPQHSIGVNYARTGAGWLLSPQYGANEELWELRYQWRPRTLPLVEARVRRRRDLKEETGAVRQRDVFDFFLRVTWRFRTLAF